MRIWDVSPGVLCRQHLLGEHRELHAVWAIIVGDRRGFARHPEVLRWHGRLRALYTRHEALVAEMTRRGYRHRSALDESLATGDALQETYVDTPEEQVRLLAAKGCECRV
jgi:hypothetical protein